jgi:hypothetical protein
MLSRRTRRKKEIERSTARNIPFGKNEYLTGMNKKKNTKQELDIPDEYSQMLLIRHIYLSETCKLILAASKSDSSIRYNHPRILNTDITRNALKNFRINEGDIGQNFSYLVADGYLIAEDLPDGVTVSCTQKGWIAMTDGEFKQKHDNRQRLLREVQELIDSKNAYRHQKTFNILVVIATALAALMPWVVAMNFPPTVNVPAQSINQDIRIDSVWLQHEIDASLYKRQSNQK